MVEAVPCKEVAQVVSGVSLSNGNPLGIATRGCLLGEVALALGYFDARYQFIHRITLHTRGELCVEGLVKAQTALLLY